MLILALAHTAFADVYIPPWKCGVQFASSIRGDGVPLNATMLVRLSDDVSEEAFYLDRNALPIPMTRLSSGLVELHLGPLGPQRTYVVRDATGGMISRFTTGTEYDAATPRAPRVVWSDREYPHLELVADPDISVLLATAVGPKERFTYFMGPHFNYSWQVMRPECLERAGISTDEPICFELVAVDRAGHRSPPTFTCHDMRLPLREGQTKRELTSSLSLEPQRILPTSEPPVEWPWRKLAAFVVAALAIAGLVAWRSRRTAM